MNIIDCVQLRSLLANERVKHPNLVSLNPLFDMLCVVIRCHSPVKGFIWDSTLGNAVVIAWGPFPRPIVLLWVYDATTVEQDCGLIVLPPDSLPPYSVRQSPVNRVFGLFWHICGVVLFELGINRALGCYLAIRE